jgi:hypothetical protein
MSSFAETLGIGVCMCIYSVFVLSCLHVAALWGADHSSMESCRLCKNDYKTEEEARDQPKSVELLMNEWKIFRFEEEAKQDININEAVLLSLRLTLVSCLASNGLHGVIALKIYLFVITAQNFKLYINILCWPAKRLALRNKLELEGKRQSCPYA